LCLLFAISVILLLYAHALLLPLMLTASNVLRTLQQC